MEDAHVNIFHLSDVSQGEPHRHLLLFLRCCLFSILARMLVKLYHVDQVPYICFQVCRLGFQGLDHNLVNNGSRFYSLRYRLHHDNLQSLRYRYLVNQLDGIGRIPYHEVEHRDDMPLINHHLLRYRRWC